MCCCLRNYASLHACSGVLGTFVYAKRLHFKHIIAKRGCRMKAYDLRRL